MYYNPYLIIFCLSRHDAATESGSYLFASMELGKISLFLYIT